MPIFTRLSRRVQQEEDEAREVLQDSLRQTQVLIAQAYAGFNTTADPDLVESYVFEISALQARYSYLLRQLKALDGEPSLRAVPAPQPVV